MNENLTLFKILSFFQSFKGDEIVFENSFCGIYTDFYSKILEVKVSSLDVEVNKRYANPDCVDNNNHTNVSINSIRQIIHKQTTFKEFEMDSKIINLEAFLKKNKTINKSDLEILNKLLKKFKEFYSEILLEGVNAQKSIQREIKTERFHKLFLNL